MFRPVLLPALLLAAAPAARAGWFGSCVSARGNGPVQTRTVQVADWDRFSFAGSGSVALTVVADPSQARSVTVSAPSDVLALYKIGVENGQLSIEPKEGCIRGRNELKVTANVAKLSRIELAGAADLTVAGRLAGEKLNIELAGSGTIALDGDYRDMHTEIAGSGEISLRGSAARHEVEIAGSGELSAAGLATRVSEVEIAGSGDCEIAVSDALMVEVAGSGDVVYHGTPGTIRKDISGSGSVRAADPGSAVREPAPPAAPAPPRAPARR